MTPTTSLSGWPPLVWGMKSRSSSLRGWRLLACATLALRMHTWNFSYAPLLAPPEAWFQLSDFLRGGQCHTRIRLRSAIGLMWWRIWIVPHTDPARRSACGSWMSRAWHDSALHRRRRAWQSRDCRRRRAYPERRERDD